MRPIALCLTLSLASAIPGAAMAVDAPQLEREFAAALDAVAAGEDAFLAYENVEVRPDGSAFDVTIDGMRLAPGAGGAFEVGRVDFRLVPEDGDLYDVSDLRLPAKIPYRDAEGMTRAVLEIPSVTFAGSWSKRLQGFLAANAAAHELRLTDPAGGLALSLGDLALRIDGEETAPGRWSRMNLLTAEALGIDAPGWQLDLDGLSLRSQVEGWVPLDRVMRGATDLIAKQAVAALLQAGCLAPKGSSRLGLRGLSLRDAEGGEALHLADAELALAGSGFDGDDATTTLSLRYGGLVLGAAAGGDRLLDHFVPHDAKINAALEDLPGRALLTALGQVGSPLKDGHEPTEVATTFAATAQRLLDEAGSKLRLSDTAAETDITRLTLDGLLQADTTATLGVVGTLNAEIAGLDALGKRLAAMPAESGAAQPWLLLQTLRGLGAPDPAADGTTRYRYAISLAPNGTLLVNGTDLRFLISGAQP